MSTKANDQWHDQLLELDYPQLNELLATGRIDNEEYDSLCEALEKRCEHEKTHINYYWIGGQGNVPFDFCETCGHTERIN